MGKKYSEYAAENCRTKPDNDYDLFCPFCDNWKLTDSIVARKKMGMHIANHHHDEVRFERGATPPPLEALADQ